MPPSPKIATSEAACSTMPPSAVSKISSAIIALSVPMALLFAIVCLVLTQVMPAMPRINNFANARNPSTLTASITAAETHPCH